MIHFIFSGNNLYYVLVNMFNWTMVFVMKVTEISPAEWEFRFELYTFLLVGVVSFITIVKMIIEGWKKNKLWKLDKKKKENELDESWFKRESARNMWKGDKYLK